jgi:hypothetical protein
MCLDMIDGTWLQSLPGGRREMYKREFSIVPTIKVSADLVSDSPFSNEEFAIELVV